MAKRTTCMWPHSVLYCLPTVATQTVAHECSISLLSKFSGLFKGSTKIPLILTDVFFTYVNQENFKGYLEKRLFAVFCYSDNNYIVKLIAWIKEIQYDWTSVEHSFWNSRVPDKHTFGGCYFRKCETPKLL